MEVNSGATGLATLTPTLFRISSARNPCAAVLLGPEIRCRPSAGFTFAWQYSEREIAANGASQLVFNFKFGRCVVLKLLHRRSQIEVIKPRYPNTPQADISSAVETAAFVGTNSLDMFSRNAGYYRQFRC